MKGILIDDIGFKIRKFREKSGYTQQQVSVLLNIERSTYSHYELGKTIPDLKTLGKLAEIFQVPLSELLLSEGRGLAFADSNKHLPLSQNKKEVEEKLTETIEQEIKGKNEIKSKNEKDDLKVEPVNISNEREKNCSKKNNKYPLCLSDLSENEKNMVLHFRMLSPNAQKKVNEIMTEKVKNEDRLGDKFDINNR